MEENDIKLHLHDSVTFSRKTALIIFHYNCFQPLLSSHVGLRIKFVLIVNWALDSIIWRFVDGVILKERDSYLENFREN